MEYIERYWRDATPEDAIKEPPMVARFKTDDPGPVRYIIDKLVGVIRTNAWMWRTANGGYLHCQVYDAPDPGEGWRLIDVDKEQPEEDDHYLCPISNVWCFCNEWLRRVSYSKDSVVRRRIEQPKPKYVPFEWEDREQLRGRWITWKHENGLMTESQINHINQHRDGGVWFKSHDAKWLLENATFLDTGEPVGKRVQ